MRERGVRIVISRDMSMPQAYCCACLRFRAAELGEGAVGNHILPSDRAVQLCNGAAPP